MPPTLMYLPQFERPSLKTTIYVGSTTVSFSNIVPKRLGEYVSIFPISCSGSITILYRHFDGSSYNLYIIHTVPKVSYIFVINSRLSVYNGVFPKNNTYISQTYESLVLTASGSSFTIKVFIIIL